MQKKLFILLVIAGFLSMQDAVAQNLKIGFTNPAKVLSQLPEVEQIDQQIQTLVQEKDQELADKAASLQQKFAEYDQNKASMSEQERVQREEELTEMNNQFEAERENYLNEVRQKRNELMGPVIEKMNAAMAEVAEEMDLDLVLNEGTTYGDAIIFYAGSEKLDITGKIVEKIK